MSPYPCTAASQPSGSAGREVINEAGVVKYLTTSAFCSLIRSRFDENHSSARRRGVSQGHEPDARRGSCKLNIQQVKEDMR